MPKSVETLPYSLALPGVQALTPYAPGKPIAELEREYGVTNIVKLASNENPLGMSLKAKQAISAAIPEGHLYPDGNAYSLKKALAQRHNVELEQITIGNGSNDVLEIVVRCFADASCEIMYSAYAFAVYPILTQAIGARHNIVPAKNWGHDLDAMLHAITEKTKIIFIANPNNPTGTWLVDNDIQRFLNQLPENITVVIDEAYHEYIAKAEYASAEKYLTQYPNLIITRTFSKAYGLAGLRIGYGLASPAVTNLLNRVRQPFNGNSFALAAAEAALQDNDFVRQSVQVNSDGMQQLETEFIRMGLDYIPSAGNFISFDVGRNGNDVYEALLRRSIIVRPVGPYKMPNHLRVSIGLKSQNEKFIRALQEALSEVLPKVLPEALNEK